MVAAQPLCMIPVMTDTDLAKENARLKARLAETEAALADAVEAQRLSIGETLTFKTPPV